MPAVNPIVQPIVNPIVQAILGSIVPSFSRQLISELGADATFTRASTAYVKDFEGIYRAVLSGEPRFQGARRVENFAGHSEDLTDAGWDADVTANAVETATTIELIGTNNSYHYKKKIIAASLAGKIIVVSVDVTWISGATDVGIRFAISGGSPDTEAVIDLSDLSTKRVSFNIDVVADGDLIFGLDNRSAIIAGVDTGPTKVTFTNVQMEEVSGASNQAPGEYVSNGVLSSPYHGANVDGVHYFPTENGNSVASNVVTEAAGSTIADATLKGGLIEGARINNAIYSRDFTNAAWVKTNITPVKDAVGIDGVANAASTLTADAANGTVFQTVTIASAAFATSFYVKRKTGTGTIEITDNNGSNYTDITSLINSSTWTLVTINRTQANPVFGFRIVTSGDEIEVDMTGLEAGDFPSSPIPTTTVAVPRALDGLEYTTAGWFNDGGAGAVIFEGYVPFVGTIPAYGWSLDDGTTTDAFQYLRTSGVNSRFIVFDTSVIQADMNIVSQWVDGQTSINGCAWDTNDFIQYLDGLSISTDNSGSIPTSINILKLGKSQASGAQWFGCIKNFKYYNTRIPDAELASLTT